MAKSVNDLLWIDEERGAGETAKDYATMQAKFDAKLQAERQEQIQKLRALGTEEGRVRAALMEQYGN